MAANSTCRLWKVGAKLLIPLLILGSCLTIIIFTFDLDSRSSAMLLNSFEHSAPKDLERTEDESGAPAIELPHPYDLIIATATEYGVDPALVLAVADIESNYKVDAMSHKGAIGVMQLMPATARELGVNPYILEENIEGGVRYLAKLLAKYGDVKLALAAYNAGMGIVDRYGGVPPFRETQNYVKKVLSRYGEYSDLVRLALRGVLQNY